MVKKFSLCVPFECVLGLYLAVSDTYSQNVQESPACTKMCARKLKTAVGGHRHTSLTSDLTLKATNSRGLRRYGIRPAA
jgi:hypothetical protein